MKRGSYPNPSAPVLLAGDISIYDTLEEVFAVAVYEGYGRAEACAAVPYAVETLQQQAFVGLVVVAVGSVSCRVYARLAAQSLHFESRVVGKAVEPRTRAYVPRLGQRVAFEHAALDCSSVMPHSRGVTSVKASPRACDTSLSLWALFVANTIFMIVVLYHP